MRTLFLVFGLAAAVETQLNPITRVAELLEGLAKKIAEDGKAEQDLYDKFKCWCTKVINAKATSIDANKQRIGELSAYIDDLSSGRVELTSERTTLEDEIKALEKTIQEENEMREKEHTDYLAAKDEMEKAVAALESAVQTLGDATKDHMALSAVHTQLKQAVKVGKGFLAKQDLSTLEALAKDVPDVDWKKLNREATFKKKYTASSGNIQNILGDMLTTFTDNLNEAIAAEEKASADFDTLMEAKTAQMEAAKQALLDKSGENGARGKALADSENEKGDLEGQSERDVKFLADTKQACEEKAKAWSERKRLRAEEIASIGEAIGILRSDDARDTFNKSFNSQTLVQLSKKASPRATKALNLLRRATSRSHDERVAALASTLVMMKEMPEAEINEADPFKEVIEAIDKLITDLETEEKDDLAQKDQCEKERMENSQNAKMTSKKIDTNTETIDRLTAQIAAANKTIGEIEEQIADLETEKRDAGDQREKETREWNIADADDSKAAELVDSAIGVLKKFRTDNQLDLMQVRRHGQEPFVAAGEAPTPPPSTFGDEGYGGAKGEQQGIVMIMEMVRDDIIKDQAKAKKEEDEAAAAHTKFIEDCDATITARGESKATLEGEMASDESAMTDEEKTRTSNQEELKSTLAFLKDIAPGCDFIAINFNTRLTNRQAEMDGLKKAKAILNGADFGL
jgi:hypothetical protein